MKIFDISLFWFSVAPSYYGLMYVLGFLYGYWALKKTWHYTRQQLENLFLYIFVWVILGGRLWYILFYNFSSYLTHPLDIFKIWEWGMSFHGGLLWVIVALVIFSVRYKITFLSLSDDIARVVPIGIFFGRMGNYLNKELLGFEYSWFLAVTTAQWSFFPSPLIEALLEWIVLYIILNAWFHPPRFTGQIASIFLILYGIFRLCIEITIRMPDAHLGYALVFLSRWAILSLIMIIFWVGIYLYLFYRNTYAKY